MLKHGSWGLEWCTVSRYYSGITMQWDMSPTLDRGQCDCSLKLEVHRLCNAQSPPLLMHRGLICIAICLLVCLTLTGCVRATLCTNSMVQDYVVHHPSALCATDQCSAHGDIGGTYVRVFVSNRETCSSLHKNCACVEKKRDWDISFTKSLIRFKTFMSFSFINNRICARSLT